MFNWDRGVNAVEVVDVDIIDSQLRQGLVERLLDVLRVGPDEPTGLSMGSPELRSKKYLIALSGLLEPTWRKRGREYERPANGTKV